MKKITLLLAMLVMSLGYSQSPTEAAPTPPVRNAVDVISVFSDAYTPVGGVNINPGWGQATTATEVSIAGNNTLSYANFNYQGTDFETQNISEMEFLHIDVWTNNQSPNVFVISSGDEIPHAISESAGAWKSLDIPVANITGDLNAARQFKFDNGNGGTIYLDNLYFWKTAADPLKDASLIDLKVEGMTINGFSSAKTNYLYEIQLGTTVVPQITEAIASNVDANLVITQSSTVPGDATVTVTSADGTTVKNYVISFAATLPNSAPIPVTLDSTVLSVYGDTGGFTNIWTPDYAFGSYVDVPDLEPGTEVNQAIKMDFSIEGYGEGTNVATDVTEYNWVHFDYFAQPGEAGVSGHHVRFILIGGGEFNYEMTPTGNDGTLIFGSWQSVDIPLSFFEGKGFNKTNYLQFKLGTESDLNTKVVYFDNIYFSVNKGTVLGTQDFEHLSFSTYPNPTSDYWIVKTQTTKIEIINVVDISGKTVLRLSPNANEAQINGTHLQAGIYFAQIKTLSGVHTLKLLKK
ncbi:T9SS type A sorting domain-containing protein [Formosa sp. 3Alg 14/1]|uniref:T9SS type A sorting domain-containing protein n=1 Tax=Formosa sp. 3Alg 14/1 TaxID=3382190 RepID=UPI0039BDB3FF